MSVCLLKFNFFLPLCIFGFVVFAAVVVVIKVNFVSELKKGMTGIECVLLSN